MSYEDLLKIEPAYASKCFFTGRAGTISGMEHPTGTPSERAKGYRALVVDDEVPPATLQLSGQAKVLDWTDDEGRDSFRQFWIGRRILEAYEESYRRGETRICFLKITPDPVINTYMVGSNIWRLRNHMESGAAKVVDPRGNP